MQPLPPIHGYWDSNKPQEKGDSSSQPMHIAVGQVASVWESIEDAFAYLFQIFVEGKTHAAARAYGAMASNSIRRDAITEAAKVFFVRSNVSNSDQEHFNLLMKHFQIGASKRNEVIHAIVVGFTFDNVPHGYFLVPPNYNSRKTQPFVDMSIKDDKFNVFRSNYRFTSADIVSLLSKLNVLHHSALEYCGHIAQTYSRS